MDLIEIGKHIRERRKELGLDQSTLIAYSHWMISAKYLSLPNLISRSTSQRLLSMKILPSWRYGLLTEIDREHYSFCYDTDYYNNPQLPAVSLTMPKTQQEYTSSYLFPVFFNMTSEGDNRIIQARNLHIDEEDDFGILLATAHTDTIGAITIKKM